MLAFEYQKTPINHEYKTFFELEEGFVKSYLRSIGLKEDNKKIPSSFLQYIIFGIQQWGILYLVLFI